ncbi:MAG: hypothetical protein IT521_02465 [Burkholderiales bacterium]|nr:hypothetical protein [Burkholderiales bacterium]
MPNLPVEWAPSTTAGGQAQTASALLAWIEHLVDWEINRRDGNDFPLQPPDAAIPHEENAITLEEALKHRTSFAQDTPAVTAPFDAVVQLLPDGASRH